jgi:hypothetical protein
MSRFSCEFAKSKVLDEAAPDPKVRLDTNDKPVPQADDTTKAATKELDQLHSVAFWIIAQKKKDLSAEAQIRTSLQPEYAKRDFVGTDNPEAIKRSIPFPS